MNPASRTDATPAERLFHFVENSDADAFKTMLVRSPELARSRNEKGVSVIMFAAYYRRNEIVQLVIDSGLELDLFEAAATGECDRAMEILDHDAAAVNEFSNDGFTPLGLASFFGHAKLAELLLEKGADLNLSSIDSMKVAPLHASLAGQNPEIARMLIDRGADVNARSHVGLTPMHEAASTGDLEIAKLLISKGADPSLTDEEGRSPADLALQNGHIPIVDFLTQFKISERI